VLLAGANVRRGRVVLRAVGDGDVRDSCLCCISSLKALASVLVEAIEAQVMGAGHVPFFCRVHSGEVRAGLDLAISGIAYHAFPSNTAWFLTRRMVIKAFAALEVKWG